MTTARSIVCDSCGSDVPTGRLSCPACGDLLASVAGGSRRATVLHPVPSVDVETAGGTGTAATFGSERATPPILRDVNDDPSDLAPVADPPRVADEDGLSALISEPRWDAAPGWDQDTALPGAWVPPSATIAEARMPAGIAAPARVWAGHTRGLDALDEGLGAATSRVATAAPSDHVAPPAGDIVSGAPGAPGDAAAHPAGAERLDGARVAEFVGWLAISGGALSAVGFLLPWGSSMIGATGTDYVSRWGIAGPFHILVALVTVAIVVLAVVPNPVPAWIRIGIAGTMLATFLLGLVWPYVFGFSSTGPGALAVAVGAVVLLAAGIICLVTDRHRAGTPAV